MSKPLGRPHRSASSRIACAGGAAFAVACLGTELASAQGGSGGIGTPAPPQVRDATCFEACAGLRSASVGSKIVLSGARLAGVIEVSFAGDGGRVAVKPQKATAGHVVAKVPEKAATGTPRVTDSYGRSADSPEQIEIVGQGQTVPAGPFQLRQASVNSPTVYYAGKKKAQVRFVFQGSKAQDVRVEVVNRDTNQVVRTLVVPDVSPGQPATASWNGLGTSHGVAPNGSYKFRIAPVSGGEGEDGGGATNFTFYGYKFPIPRGKHTYGDGVGAGRNHAGQDVLADCGLPLVAVRAGKVVSAGYGYGGGNYLILDAKNDRHTYVYMHLRDKPLVAEGARVKTGQKLGYVGDTGDATTCHLHFEMHDAAGAVMTEVTRFLRKLDSWS